MVTFATVRRKSSYPAVDDVSETRRKLGLNTTAGSGGTTSTKRRLVVSSTLVTWCISKQAMVNTQEGGQQGGGGQEGRDGFIPGGVQKIPCDRLPRARLVGSYSLVTQQHPLLPRMTTRT